MSEEKNTVTENKMEDKNMTLSETAKQDTEESIKKEAEKNEIMTSPEKAEETVKDESEKEEPKEKDELLLSEESEKITNEELTSQNLPVKIKPEDLSVEPILSSDSDEVFIEKIKHGIELGLEKIKCGFKARIIVGALFAQLKEKKKLLEQLGYKNVYEFGEKNFGMSTTLICKCMQIYQKLGKIDPETHTPCLKDEFQNYSFSVLDELSTVKKEELQRFIGKDLTVKEVREMKKNIKQRDGEPEGELGQVSEQSSSQTGISCEQGNSIYNEAKASDCADTKDSEVEAEYEDLSENRLYSKEIKVTQKITYDTKALRKCLDEFKEQNPDYKGNIKIVFYKCEISEEA